MLGGFHFSLHFACPLRHAPVRELPLLIPVRFTQFFDSAASKSLVPAAQRSPNVDPDARLFRINELDLVSQMFASWNQMVSGLSQRHRLRRPDGV